MFKALPALKDAYITDRIINGLAQTGANVGSAGSLDLFKLYGVTTTTVSGSSVPNTELCRLLVQFDLSSLRAAVAAGQVDPNNASFNCRLHLFDVYGGQPTPNNFTVSVYPLSASFDEGFGRDVVYYSDLDTCNWLTGSVAGGAWFVTGCGLGGISTSSCDYITALSGGLSLQASQTFVTGLEDLDVDITPIVSATLAGLLPDVGLRISLSAPLEANLYTYFVKRFASRTAFNNDLAPVLYVRFDDSIQDDTANAYLDSTNYLFLYNFNRSAPANLTSGSSPIVGKNCLQLLLVSDFPALNPGVISSSIVLAAGVPFAFLPTSDVLFSGTYTGSLSGPNLTTGSQLVGSVFSGTVPPSSLYVPRGTFVLADGITPALSSTAYFTGTLGGITDFYMMTGTFVPDGTYLFSASFQVSSTLGPVAFTLGPFASSQLYFGTNPQTGIYSASVMISSTDPDLLPQWQASGSVTFTPVWQSLDGTFPYLTGSALKVFAPQRGSHLLSPRRFEVTVLGVREEFDNNEQTVLRVNIFDYTLSYVTSVGRLPVEIPGVSVRDVHYQVRDVTTQRIVVPFDTVTNSTRVSNDSSGMYFKLDTSSLTVNRSYVIDVLIVTGNNQQLYKAASPAFRVGAVS
jgi:hypothetical protein